MAEAITIARPYANAVYSIAKEKNNLKDWSDLLTVLSQCVEDKKIQSIITSPLVSSELIIGIFAEFTCKLGNDGQNFLSLLGKNNRLQLLSEVAVLFKQLREETEKVITADVLSAMALTAEQEETISALLERRLGRNVALNVNIDKSLLGGAIIRVGDLIIDGSALNKLNKLANALS